MNQLYNYRKTTNKKRLKTVGQKIKKKPFR